MQHEAQQLNLKFVRARRDAGIASALDHAEREVLGWGEEALRFVRHFAETHVDFMAEDVIAAAKTAVPAAPDGRAWGAVFRAAARAGVIEKLGFRPAKTSNLSPKVAWGSRVLDLHADFGCGEWKKLMRSYIRAYRMNVRQEGFTGAEVLQYAANLGMAAAAEPRTGHIEWLFDLLRDEGLEWSQDKGWWKKACCSECGGAAA